MHRSVTIAVSPDATDRLTRSLHEIPGVVGLTLHRGVSLKPVGDQVVVECLNTAADDVLEKARLAVGEGPLSVTTAEIASLTDRSVQDLIDSDSDEAVWEEMESRLLQEGSATSNFVALTAFGGVVAMAGLISDPVNQAIALVSASVIAPGFEPLAKLPLGIVLGRGKLISTSIRAAAIGYVVLGLAAALTLWLLVNAGHASVSDFTDNSQVQKLSTISPIDVLISAGGALAGMTMVAAFRHDVLPGALMALMLIPAVAMVGGALALGQTDLAIGGLKRAGIDMGLMIAAGVLVFTIKRMTVHRRRSLRH